MKKAKTETKESIDIKYISVLELLPNPYQPESRVKVDVETAKKFGLSIQQHGLIQTPVVRASNGHYQIADGWLRRAGFLFNLQELGLKEFETMPCVVRELTDQQMADMVMEANTIRKDLDPIDLAKFYKRYLDDFKVPQVELARRHNCSQGEIANTIRLLDLPEDIQAKIISREISETHGRQLLRLNYNPKLQQEAFLETIKGGKSVSELSNNIGSKIWFGSMNIDPDIYDKPVFDLTECQTCQSRQKIGYPYSNEVKKWRCLNKECYQRKEGEVEEERVAKLSAEIAAVKAASLDKTKGKGKKGQAGIVDCSKLNWRDYQELDREYHKIDDPKQCKTCVHRVIGSFYGGRIGPICTNVKCFKEKEKAYEAKQAAKTREEERQLSEKVKAICDRVTDESLVLKVITDYLLAHCSKDTRERFARLYQVTVDDCHSLFVSTEGVKVLPKVAALVVQMERYEGEKGRFKKMLGELEGTSAEVDKEMAAFREVHCKTCKSNVENRFGKDEGGCRLVIREYLKGKCYAYTKMEEEEEEKTESEDQQIRDSLPCKDCKHAPDCDRSFFYTDDDGYVCDRKSGIKPSPLAVTQ